MYDLVIRGGKVIDPSQDLEATCDVAVADGRIVAVERSLAGKGRQELDATGLIVLPGLVDIHTHVYPYVSHYGICADEWCLPRGVTTVVDAGTAGRCTWPGLKHWVCESSRTRVYCFLHISGMGLLSDYVGEAEELRWLNPAAARILAAENPALIKGIKVRLDRNRVGASGLEPLLRAKAAADPLGLPIMVHVGKTPVPLAEIVAQLKPGDIVTHTFHGWEHGVLDEGGKVFPELRAAAQRGIIFDVGHGAGSFSFLVAEAALAAGFLPGTISSDLHTYNIHGPVYDLPTVMAKFLFMGLSLREVVARVTVGAARAVGLAEVAGSLVAGRTADIALLQEVEGRFRFDDCFGNVRFAPRTLLPRYVCLGGELHPARSAAPWR
jgi:dihydroorotase